MSTPKSQSVAPIRAEAVATKLAAIRNMEYPELHAQLTSEPRLAELLWFIQYVSMQPGGLGKFCAELLDQNRSTICTDLMRSLGVPKSGRYTAEQTHQILSNFPIRCRLWMSFEMREFLRSGMQPGEFEADRLLDWGEERDAQRDQARNRRRSIVEEELEKITYEEICSAVYKSAVADLPNLLLAMCTEEAGFDATWYFPDLIPALLAAMDAQRAKVAATVAMTEVAQQVFDALEYARAENGMVEIIGDSRFGKTQALKAWCTMRPGIARLVAVPSSNSETDLYKAVGAALGITFGIAPDTHLLKDRIEFVVRHGGLMLVFDESHFLWPVKFNKTTAPARLNWIRTELVDKGIPVALCYTPQAWDQVRTTFLRTTKYATEQFSGRRLLQKVLPKELSKTDLLAVARIHFPDLDADFLDYIVETARASEGYIAIMEAVAKRVRYKAQAKRGKVTFEDIESATFEVAPELAAPDASSEPGQRKHAGSKKRDKSILTSDSRTVKPVVTRDSMLSIETPSEERFSAHEAESAAA